MTGKAPMKGILLAGGSGTRLYPATLSVSKQLMPVYDKPMIYYPLSTLMLAGLRDILVISTPQDTPRFQQLLGDGYRWGLHLDYAIQTAPEGLPQAYTLGERFLDGCSSVMALGDNIFYGHNLAAHLKNAADLHRGASCFVYPVQDPERYGVVELDADGKAVTIEEKPDHPRSRLAMTGLYFCDAKAPEIARSLKPSSRGELEITDLMKVYMARGELNVQVLGRGHAWLDTGTHDSLIEASQFIQTLEKRQGLKVACPEEVAWRNGWIDDAQLEALAKPFAKSGYGKYMLGLLENSVLK
ncbi:MAG TPA: glucose-1-phosphate thymidylyltransferase RfbA [Limnobacter sp.]|uniref:glucose-1-phosphate thymidylyltransferase RfbA n=1 Tax=Limnobacter sp. TaxID=2003368 RepID=UPI002ED91D3D